MTRFEQDLVDFALVFADRAQEIHQQSPAGYITKPDGSPQTLGDTTIEREFAGEVRRTFSGHSVHGEEGLGFDVPNPQVEWSLDPTDGTWAGILGIATATFAAGAIDPATGDGLAAVVRNLTTGDTYWATRSGRSYKNHEPISVANRLPEHGLLIGGTASNAGRESLASDTYYKLTLQPDGTVLRQRVSVGPTVFKMCQVAEGLLDGGMNKGWRVHDLAAGSLIVQRALRDDTGEGGRFTDLRGNPQPLNVARANGGIFSSGAPGVHELLVAEMRDVRVG